MLSFESDYIAGAHPRIIERLAETNIELLSGYGSDCYCTSATDKIRAACGTPNADVFFLTGGTQTNQIVISTMLAPYEGVIAANSGHVSTHEAGAIEYTGHKVLNVPGHYGKMYASELDQYISNFYNDSNHEHMVYPGMVYISYPTEYGTLYSKSELENIYSVCRKYNIKLYIDGARLGYGLASKSCDITLKELSALCDAFYIGGTKVGALCGEAVVFPDGASPAHFMTQVKQHGALLAKGRLIGIQFDTLFTDDLYMQISRHAIDLAEKLKKVLIKNGLELYIDSPTNQQFTVLSNDVYEKLNKECTISFWESKDDNHTVVRFATSWSTKEEDITALDTLLKKYCSH